jgi:hypothetical protein
LKKTALLWFLLCTWQDFLVTAGMELSFEVITVAPNLVILRGFHWFLHIQASQVSQMNGFLSAPLSAFME